VDILCAMTLLVQSAVLHWVASDISGKVSTWLRASLLCAAHCIAAYHCLLCGTSERKTAGAVCDYTHGLDYCMLVEICAGERGHCPCATPRSVQLVLHPVLVLRISMHANKDISPCTIHLRTVACWLHAGSCIVCYMRVHASCHRSCGSKHSATLCCRSTSGICDNTACQLYTVPPASRRCTPAAAERAAALQAHTCGPDAAAAAAGRQQQSHPSCCCLGPLQPPTPSS
jgi:hypothetical protein